jgi:hypothetical protein
MPFEELLANVDNFVRSDSRYLGCITYAMYILRLNAYPATGD